tara:strand:+ start:547 stop:1578 length:1032 start_codon:yes stop_codon:yes gene_type:complete
MKFKASEIAELVGGEVEGNKDIIIHDFSKIEQGSEGTLTFLSNPKYEEFIYNTKASVALVNKDFTPSQSLPIALTLIRVENAYEKLAQLLSLYNEFKSEKKGIENPSFIDPSATIGKDVYIGAFSYLGPNVKIGDGVQIHPGSYVGANSIIDNNVILFPGVKIYHNIQIGKYCVLHAGAVVGSDGFGFAPNSSNEYKKIPQVGNVIIKDYVEIGANTTIDRATIGSTVIEKGVKLDNLVQIAHNVEIGENTVIAAQTGIAGSTKIGRDVMIGGQVGINGHITITDGTKIAAQSGVAKSINQPSKIIQGSPALDIGNFTRSYVLFKNLPKLKKQVENLERKINS